MSDLGFVHRYVPGSSGRVLLLLHGTGGNEDDLLPLGRDIAPGAALLSPRGKVLENGMPRFFRRLAEGVFDVADLKQRTDELAAFVQACGRHYGFEPRDVIALGFSNGANIAASLLLKHPGLIRGGILFRAMLPFEPDPVADLRGTPVLLSEGQEDVVIPRPSVDRLIEVLRQSGAELTLEWQPTGHRLTLADIDLARSWIAAVGGGSGRA